MPCEEQTDDIWVEEINVNSKLKLDSLRQDMDDRQRDLIRVMMTRVEPNSQEFYIRLADNLNYFVHHDGKVLKIGELDLFIP